MKNDLFIEAFLLLVFLGYNDVSFSQELTGNNKPYNFSAAVTITNNGISMIPTFTLGKPAAVFDMSVGRKLSFDPQFRFALEGKPWSFVFWWRYEIIKTGKFQMKIGAHPAFAFKTITVAEEDGSKEIIRVQRFLAGELSPNYFVGKYISIGIYYLYAHGFEQDATRNTHYLTFNSNLSRIPLAGPFFMKYAPQIYYLKMDTDDGFYFASTLTLAHKNFPLTVSSTINKVIRTNISASKDFVWNINLIYAFSNNYSKIQ
jgi:hypothetical protein